MISGGVSQQVLAQGARKSPRAGDNISPSGAKGSAIKRAPSRGRAPKPQPGSKRQKSASGQKQESPGSYVEGTGDTEMEYGGPSPSQTTDAAAEPEPEVLVPEVNDDTSCIICLDAERSHLLTPCGHRCLCKGCAEDMELPRRCPICRAFCDTIVDISCLTYGKVFH